MKEFEIRIGEHEIRLTDDHEIRLEEREDGVVRLTGYAALFNRLSVPLGGFREVIRSGAFAKGIKNPDIRALWNHESGKVLGRQKNGSLQVWEDDKGLGFRVAIPNTTWGRDATETIRRGDVDQMSFGFRVPKGGDRWTEPDGENKDALRELVDVELVEVSPVSFPAYPQTTVTLRDLVLSMAATEEKGPHGGPEIALLRKRLTTTAAEV